MSTPDSTERYNNVLLFEFDETTLSFNAVYPEKLAIRGVTENEFKALFSQCDFIHQSALQPVKKNKIKHGILIGIGGIFFRLIPYVYSFNNVDWIRFFGNDRGCISRT